MSSHETLGLILVREGLITRPQLYDALRLQRQNNRLLGTCLLALGYVEPDRLLAILGKQLAVPALPRGILMQASREAINRVPAEVAHRLRIVPYSWDGEMLGVAVADGRVLNHLHEVALYAKAAIGAYVALETEIEETLGKLYPQAEAATAPAPLTGRPRPPTLSVAAAPASAAAAERRQTRPKPPAFAPIEKVSFYDAVEKIYEAETVRSVGRAVGQALLNYFQRVVVFERQDTSFTVVAYGGVTPSRTEGALEDLPQVRAQPRGLAHGLTTNDPRAGELARYFGLGSAATFLLAPIAAEHTHALVAYGDNGDLAETYDDLHELEMVVKEADTAIQMLVGS